MNHELTAKWHELDKVRVGLKDVVVFRPDLSTIQRQIGDLSDLTTEAKENLVAAINEAAASGGSGSMACDACHGAGSFTCSWCGGALRHVCPICWGEGVCSTCGGTGIQ